MKIFGRRSLDPLLPEAPLSAPDPATGITPEPEPASPAAPDSASLQSPNPQLPGPDPQAPRSRLRERVLKQIDPSAAANLTPESLRREVEQIIHDLANEERIELTGAEQFRLADELANDMAGFGPLQILLEDESITDIMVNSPTAIFIERRGRLEQAKIRFRDPAHIAGIAQKIAARIGRRIDESSPMVDARLPDGSRVNVVFPPLAIDSPCISIRKFPKRRIDFPGMVRNGSLTEGVARLLEIAARCRLNLLISGGTGSGKTTLLNAMSQFISHSERIITIEDAAELQLQQPHVIRLETRPPSLEGTGAITQRDLVRNALRMRPDRIIVGEVRSEEAFDMLQAMNTGHDGSISTIHANSARDALTRVENMLQMASVSLPLRAIRTQIVSALDLIVQVERMRDGVRRITQITEICGLEGDTVTSNDVVTFDFAGIDEQGAVLGKYQAPHPVPGFRDRLSYYNCDRAWIEATRMV